MNQITVAARLTGGLGDVLMASPFLEKLYDSLGAPSITCYYHTPQAAAFVFSGARFVSGISSHTDLLKLGRRSADLLVHTGHFPRYIVQNERTMRWAPEQFQQALKISDQRCGAIAGLIAAHPKLDGFWARMMTAKGQSYLDGMGWLSGLEVSRNSHPFLALDPTARVSAHTTKPYITIHDGFDVRQPAKAGQATKCWPIRHWAALVEELHRTLPDVRIVQLGAGKSRPIPGVDAMMVNQTTLSQTAWILKDAALHIDTDSGLAHMARCLHTPAVVMFGPTNAAYFGHKQNSNIAATVCSDCWWSTPDWLAKCPRGLREPECMSSISVSSVMLAVGEQLIAEAPRAVLQASALFLYDGMDSGTQSLADMVAELGGGMERGPITQHLVNGTTGVYVHASKQWEYAYALKAMPSAIKGLRVADVGGGRGALAPYLARLGADVTQFDRDYEWGGNVLTESAYRSWATSKGYQARYGSIYNLPCDSASQDVVLCISVLEHLPEKTAALRELLRILKPGGILVLTFDYALISEQFTDKYRIEVTDPLRLATLLDSVGIFLHNQPSEAEVLESIARIAADSVLGIPDGMTVAGLVIHKAASATAQQNGARSALLEVVPA